MITILDDSKTNNDKNADVRSAEYILRPLFIEKCDIFKNFELNDYICENSTMDDLTRFRNNLCVAHKRDAQLIREYYMNCKRQIYESVVVFQAQKKKKQKEKKLKKRVSKSKRHSFKK